MRPTWKAKSAVSSSDALRASDRRPFSDLTVEIPSPCSDLTHSPAAPRRARSWALRAGDLGTVESVYSYIYIERYMHFVASAAARCAERCALAVCPGGRRRARGAGHAPPIALCPVQLTSASLSLGL
jgi:hypothetical protein